MTRLAEDDLRAALAWLKALIVGDTEGLRAVARNVEHTRLVHGLAVLAGALPIDPADPVGWADRTFHRIAEIARVAEAHQHRADHRDAAAAATDLAAQVQHAHAAPPTSTPPAAPAADPPEPTTTTTEGTSMTIKTTMTLAEQLVALARLDRVALDPSYAVNSKTIFSTEYTDGGPLRELVPLLRKAGIEPTDAAKFDALAALELPKPTAPEGRRLDLTPEAYAARIREVASYAVTRLDAQRHIGLERTVLTRELQQSMRAEADAYLEALRPAFDSAIADFRTIAELGLTINSTPEAAMQLGPDAVTAWLRMTGPKGMTKVLDAIAGIRIRISRALGVQPVNTEAGGGQVRYGVAFGVGNQFDEYEGWRRWLAIASSGTANLRPIAEVEAIRAERRRAAFGLAGVAVGGGADTED